MKVKIDLSEFEIKTAIANAIKEKIAEANFYTDKIKLNGSVKFKNKSIRKDIKRITASVEYSE